MAQVQIEFSKIATPDTAGQARQRAANLPGTHDFASMIDAASNDASAPATHAETRFAKSPPRSDGSSSRRTDPAAASGGRQPERSDSTRSTPAAEDESRSRAADRVADTTDMCKTSPPGKSADKSDDSDPVAGSDREGDDKTSAAAAAAAPVAPLNAFAPDGAPADDATKTDAIANPLTAGADVPTADADPARADAEYAGNAGESSNGLLVAALVRKNSDGEPAVDENGTAIPHAGEAEAAPIMTHVEGKNGKGSKTRAEGAAGMSIQAGDEPAVDGRQAQSQQPDPSDAAKSPPATELSHKGTHVPVDGATGKSGTKDGSNDTTAGRSNGLNIGAAAAAANPAIDSAAMSVGAAAGIAPVGGMSPTGATAATAPAASPQSDAASTTATLADLGVAIATQAKAGRRSFEIRLDPEELGHIHVRLDVDRDGTVTSRLIVDRADTLDLLRRDAPQLQRALQDAGLKADAQTMQFSLRDQNAGQQGGHNTQHSAARSTDLDVGTRLDEVPSTYSRLSSRTGGLDIRI